MTITKEWLQKAISDIETMRDEIPFGLDEDGNNTLVALKMALAGMESMPVGITDKSEIECLKRGEMANVMPPDYKGCDVGDSVCLYAAPQPATVVPGELTREEYKRRFMEDDNFDDTFRGGWNACRAAMLQGADGTLTNEGTMPTTQFKPVADLYGITSPTGSETSFTFDAVEARDFIDGGWSCQEYVELERYQAAMVNHPEDNLDMVDHSGDANEKGNSPVIPDGWVACSERMPPENDIVLVVDDGYFVCEAQHREGDFYSAVRGGGEFFETTCRDVEFWQPLPAAPQQEVKP